jgi:hypothetical protein
MEVKRCRFVDQGQTLIIDVPVEVVDGVERAIKGFGFFGEWLDGEGDTYQFAVRYDGQVDFGKYGKDCGQVPGTLEIHGRAMISNAVFPYRSTVEDYDFELSTMNDGHKKETFITLPVSNG